MVLALQMGLLMGLRCLHRGGRWRGLRLKVWDDEGEALTRLNHHVMKVADLNQRLGGVVPELLIFGVAAMA